MTIQQTQRTPVAELGGDRDEGLNPTPIKEQESPMVSAVPTRIQCDQFTVIDVDPRDQSVEITFSSSNEFGDARSTYGITLVPEEARQVASALLDGVAPDLGTADPEDIEEHVAVARKLGPVNVAPVALSPAQWCKAKKDQDHIDVDRLAHGTVLDLLATAARTGVDPAVLLELCEEGQR